MSTAEFNETQRDAYNTDQVQVQISSVKAQFIKYVIYMKTKVKT